MSSNSILNLPNGSTYNLPVGVPNDIVNIDSIQYQAYKNSGNRPSSYGLVNLDTDLKEQDIQYTQQLESITQQILNLYNNLFKAQMSINNLMSLYKEGFTGGSYVDSSLFSSSLKESFVDNSMPVVNPNDTLVNKYKKIEAKVKILDENRNMDNIIEDRTLVATQQNYLYILVLLITLGTIGVFYKYTKI
jgi:hypothetical protein